VPSGASTGEREAVELRDRVPLYRHLSPQDSNRLLEIENELGRSGLYVGRKAYERWRSSPAVGATAI
jgi:enolase